MTWPVSGTAYLSYATLASAGEKVLEGVRELLKRQRDDAVPLRRVRESRRARLQLRERQRENAFRRRWAQRDARAPETAVEQHLDEEPAERVADQDRRLVERANLRLVVVEDLGYP